MPTELKVRYLDFDRIIATPEFIAASGFSLMRTPAEIFAKIKGDDGFGFYSSVLFDYISYPDARVLLSAESQAKFDAEHSSWTFITSLEEATQDFLDYMVFAWGKALDQRGLSAGRSIEKLEAWLWLLGREDLAATIRADHLYAPYGMPALEAVCDALGIDCPDAIRNGGYDEDEE